MGMQPRSSLVTGVVLAVGSALAFGVTLPVVAWAGRGVGAWTTASVLYAGAALASLALWLLRGKTDEGGALQRRDTLRIVAVAAIGGALAPTLLAWGLQRSGAGIGSLLLNLEAIFTVLLARAFFAEPIGARVALAVAAMGIGGALLTFDVWRSGTWQVAGLLAVIAATASWATDNTLTRPLAQRDPLQVVAAKGCLGAAFTFVGALLWREHSPAWSALLILLLCGATGYGASLRLYLLAQRYIGAGRTGSIFALAPFVGAAIAFAVGDRGLSAWTLGATLLFMSGVWLHVTERHAHRHAHPALTHSHPHRHDDLHHLHHHEPAVNGEHSHPHTHAELHHQHDHAPDIHHDHSH
jgi:drug/metabolite transporter (DMT)-like permease